MHNMKYRELNYILNNQLACDRVVGQEFNIIRYYSNSRISKKAKMKMKK